MKTEPIRLPNSTYPEGPLPLFATSETGGRPRPPGTRKHPGRDARTNPRGAFMTAGCERPFAGLEQGASLQGDRRTRPALESATLYRHFPSRGSGSVVGDVTGTTPQPPHRPFALGELAASHPRWRAIRLWFGGSPATGRSSTGADEDHPRAATSDPYEYSEAFGSAPRRPARPRRAGTAPSNRKGLGPRRTSCCSSGRAVADDPGPAAGEDRGAPGSSNLFPFRRPPDKPGTSNGTGTGQSRGVGS